MDFITFLIHEDLYAWCLRYNISSAWFLDIRISRMSIPNSKYYILNDTNLEKVQVF